MARMTVARRPRTPRRISLPTMKPRGSVPRAPVKGDSGPVMGGGIPKPAIPKPPSDMGGRPKMPRRVTSGRATGNASRPARPRLAITAPVYRAK